MIPTRRDIALVRATLIRIEVSPVQSASAFYTHLFAHAPALRAMWDGDLLTHAEALIDTLSTAVALIDRPEALRPVLAELALHHRAHGLTPRGYIAVHAALMDMVTDRIAPTPVVEEAWANVIGAILTLMLDAAHGPRRARPSLAA